MSDLVMVDSWQGGYPVLELTRLPEGQRSLPFGCLGTESEFRSVWQKFKPKEAVSAINFREHIVIFARNVTLYNRIAIVGVLRKERNVTVLVRETMSALPIEEKLGMALAVVPRAGVKFISSGDGNLRVPVETVSGSLQSN